MSLSWETAWVRFEQLQKATRAATLRTFDSSGAAGRCWTSGVDWTHRSSTLYINVKHVTTSLLLTTSTHTHTAQLRHRQIRLRCCQLVQLRLQCGTQQRHLAVCAASQPALAAPYSCAGWAECE